MKRQYVIHILGLLFVVSAMAVTDHEPKPKEKQTYLKLELGASFSATSSVSAPLAFWDGATQGYDSDFGNRPLFAIALGHDIIPALTAELGLFYRPHYTYSKFQTPPGTTDSSPGFLGTKTRRFNFDATSLLISFFLNGRGCAPLRWESGPMGSYFYPFVAAGVGISDVTLYNFRSTGLPPNTDAFGDVSSFASENEYTKRYPFTYHVMAGFAYRLLPNWKFEIGYRWLSTARFKGPSFIRDRAGNSADLRGFEWKQRLSANELFVTISRYF